MGRLPPHASCGGFDRQRRSSGVDCNGTLRRGGLDGARLPAQPGRACAGGTIPRERTAPPIRVWPRPVTATLGACLNVEPVTLAFGYHPRGKPFLAQSAFNSDLRFNLSHSGLIVAIALARGREVGVDLESVYRLDDWSLLAERIFSSRELCELRAVPAAKQREAFFNGWTRKEAYLKATSEGLTDDLPAIEVTLVPGQKPRLLRSPAGLEAARQWAIQDIPLPRDFAGAVAIEERTASGPCASSCSPNTSWW